MLTIRADARYGRAIEATADLLSRLRLDLVFVGNVARSAWLGTTVERGSLDLIALMGPQQKNQVAMMASNRGFRVEREEIEASEELDLVPVNFVDPGGDVRVHVLVASNALYSHMVGAGVDAMLGERTLRVSAAEDLALLAAVTDTPEWQHDFETLVRMPGFDRRAFNERVVSIGLPQLAVHE